MSPLQKAMRDQRNGARLHPLHPVVLEDWRQTRCHAAKKGWRRRRARFAARKRWRLQ